MFESWMAMIILNIKQWNARALHTPTPIHEEELEDFDTLKYFVSSRSVWHNSIIFTLSMDLKAM